MNKKDIKLIPRGEMCYIADKDGVHYCPYFIRGEKGGVYCKFCDYGVYAYQIGRMDKHLWDMIKVCGKRL